MHRLAEAYVLAPIFGVLALALVWGATRSLIRLEHSSIERASVVSSQELAETYEAQVVRALREIDRTLRFVKFVHEDHHGELRLADLRERGLLLPDLLFELIVTNTQGDVIAGARDAERFSLAGTDTFEASRTGEQLVVGHPRRNADAGEWTLEFSRRLDAADGSFAGVVVISVDASYFVSGYDATRIGDHGFLGLLGTDGVFRAARSGERISAGDAIDYAALAPRLGAEAVGATLVANPWDGERRYTSARELFEFPLAVVVGVSERDEHAAVAHSARTYVRRAAAASVVLLLFVAVLGRQSWHLARSRRREHEARLAYAERVEYLAYHDSLTGLPNRSLFAKLLERGIEQARRYDRKLALLFLDLDRFKHINDTLGHEAGDALLQEVARRLGACLRSSDTVARLGGDEFVALLPEVAEIEHVARVAGNMLAATGAPFELAGRELCVTASIGIAIHPQDGADEETLTKHADVAMYQAKLEGRNQFAFYSEELAATSLDRVALESGLRQAIERGELRLHYQAKRGADGAVTGMEALLRWHHPALGTLAPLHFLPIAEESGLILPIGRWVLEQVCSQSVAWQAEGLTHAAVSVNLTARQLADDHLFHDLAAILMRTGMDPGRLELEIPETLLMRDVDNAVQILTRLKELGVRIAIDNFGIGYTSIASLGRFSVDTIKIDRSLIGRIGGAATDPDLTQAIVGIGRLLSVSIVAQGVETKAQADWLREKGCDALQGFYFDKPVPPDEFAERLRAERESASRRSRTG